MTKPACSDKEFIELWGTLQSATRVSEALGVAVAMIHRRRRNVEKRYNIKLESADSRAAAFAHLQPQIYPMWPEVAKVWDDDHIEFRSQLVNVRDA